VKKREKKSMSRSIPQTDLVTETTEQKQEFTEEELGTWSRKAWIRLMRECRNCVYSDATLCALLLASVTSVSNSDYSVMS
jgi:flagellar biosynthesis regulator FlaF